MTGVQTCALPISQKICSSAYYQANEFAKAFLMPEEEYGEILNRYTKGNRVNIKEVANHFHVAINAAANRGQLLGYFE